MSTKTTFKRIALVAVAALGFGTLSVAPSSAAVQSDSLTLAATTAAATVGTASTNVITLSFLDDNASADTVTATVALVSSPTTSTALPSVAETEAQNTANPAGATTPSSSVFSLASAGAGRVTGSATVSLTPDVAGTYVVRVTPAGGLTTTAQTWTITATGKPAVSAYGTTARMIPSYSYDSFDTMGGTWVNPWATGASAVIGSAHATLKSSVSCYSDATYAGSQCALIEVVQSNATATTSNTLVNADAPDITVSISGAGGGTVALASGFGGSNPNGYFEFLGPKGVAVYEGTGVNTYARASLTKRIAVFTTGNTGTSTVTIKAGDTVLATKTVVFYGNAAKISTATVVNSVIAPSNSNAANIGAVTAYVYDAVGNPVPGVTLYANSSATTVVSNASAVTNSSGLATFTLNGGIAGTASLKITNVAPLNTTTTELSGANSVSVRTGSVTPASVSWALDATSYVPGGLATLTVTVLDASGLAVVNGEYANIFAGASTSSLALASGTLPSGTVTTTSSTGAAKYTFNVPVTAGVMTIKNTTGTGVALANQGVAVSLSATVEGGAAFDTAQAAADAAAEATDAANAATDAANAAAEAADAATAAAQDAADAVAALSVQVAEMVDALKKQITALTNLVIKIQKKVKA